MGKGRGKGYKNIMGRDPIVHSQSRKGIKQPQKISPRVQTMLKKNPKLKNKSFKQLKKSGVFLGYQADSDGDGVVNIHDCKPLDKKKQDTFEFKDVEEIEKKPSKIWAGIKKYTKKGAKKGVEFAKEQLKERREAPLREIEHPTIKKLDRQKERVEELRTQIMTEDDTDEIDRLDTELDKEEKQLRNIQEKVTEINLEDFSEAQLKTLAISHKDSFSLFGSGNRFEDELIRRIKKRGELERKKAEIEMQLNVEREKLNKRLKEEKKKLVEEKGAFEGLF